MCSWRSLINLKWLQIGRGVLWTLFNFLLFNLMPSCCSTPLIDHCSFSLSFPFLYCIFPLILFSLFLFFLMFILSLSDLILSLFSSTKILFLCSFLFLLWSHLNCFFTALTFLSLEQMFTLFVSLNKSTFLIWSLVWLCFCFVSLSWDPVDLTPGEFEEETQPPRPVRLYGWLEDGALKSWNYQFSHSNLQEIWRSDGS